MKSYHNHLAPSLLLAYAIYTTFVTATIAHSLIILSLAILAGFSMFLSRQENTKYNEEVLRKVKEDFEAQLNGTKEVYEKKFSKLEDEVAKMALNTLPARVAPSSSVSPRKVVF
jgi:hypothetical protein